MRNKGLAAVLSVAMLCGGEPTRADCPSINMSKAPDEVARALLSGKGLILLFLGTIEREKFVGDFRRRYDLDADNAVDITYRVEDVFHGDAASTITLRTQFFCEACSYDSEAELADGLNSEIGRRVIVFEWDEVDQNGHRATRVSGGCPDSIDAWPSKDKENELVTALRRATHKN